MAFAFIWNIILIGYLVFIYILLALNNKKYSPYNKPFSIIIPCYNEDKRYLKECIRSIFKAKGKKQVILVDDGSNNLDTRDAINELKGEFPELVVLYQKNMGKRHAHQLGLKECRYDIAIFVDSDTIIDENAFMELIKPFQDENIGAVSGNVKLANEKENFLTKMISAMFWTSFNISRRASANAFYMQVCPGCLSAYRTSYLRKIMPSYINQKFLGKPCTISDDRYLTLRVQMCCGKKVAFQGDAMSYTYISSNVKGFFKTLLRWKKGCIKEILLLLFKAPNKRKNLLLVVDTFFNLLLSYTMLFFKFMLLIFLIIGIINRQYLIIALSLFSLVVIMVIFSGLHALYMLFEEEGRKKFLYKIVYNLFYEFFLFATIVPATLGIRNQGSWGTR